MANLIEYFNLENLVLGFLLQPPFFWLWKQKVEFSFQFLLVKQKIDLSLHCPWELNTLEKNRAQPITFTDPSDWASMHKKMALLNICSTIRSKTNKLTTNDFTRNRQIYHQERRKLLVIIANQHFPLGSHILPKLPNNNINTCVTSISYSFIHIY